MNLLLPLIFTVLLATGAQAESQSPQIELDTKKYSAKEFRRKNPGAEVRALPKRRPHPDAIPNRDQREKVFARVPGLAAHVEKMDELDRDLFYMRARKQDLEFLRRTYPEVNENDLTRLQSEAKKD